MKEAINEKYVLAPPIEIHIESYLLAEWRPEWYVALYENVHVCITYMMVMMVLESVDLPSMNDAAICGGLPAL